MRMPTLRQKEAIKTSELRWVADQIGRMTAGRPEPLRLSWMRLAEDEQTEIHEFTKKVSLDAGGFRFDGLGKGEGERFDALIAKAAGLSPDAFRVERHLLEIRQMGEDARRASLALPRRAKLEQAGSVTLRKEWVFDYLRDGVLWPSHVSALVLLLSIWENGGGFSPAAHVDEQGAIVVDTRRGGVFGRADPQGDLMNWRSLLDHLAANKFVAISKEGAIWRVTRGSRLLNAERRAA